MATSTTLTVLGPDKPDWPGFEGQQRLDEGHRQDPELALRKNNVLTGGPQDRSANWIRRSHRGRSSEAADGRAR